MNSLIIVPILLILSVLPAVVLGIIIYKNDKLEKEPSGLLAKLFMGGIGAIGLTTLISFIGVYILGIPEEFIGLPIWALALYSYLFVALTEEFSKWFFVKTITWNNKEFNHIYDAIVYSVFVSLGFATLENIMYVFEGGIGTALLRAVLSVPGHVFFGVFMGYYYGLAKQASINGNQKLVKHNLYHSLLLPVLLHGTFNFLLMTQNVTMVLFYLVFVVFLYIQAIKRIRRFSNIKINLVAEKKVYCHNCGTRINDMYCPRCGTKRII